ncbi:MAG: hypothetical protein A2V90_06620 [Gammaproteobacteria bacterium RBG_16_57_12]|nr:MAG: hypothetical protein A2V90_06620 [Gammaproteobacteria bacterium RBG_16_57_12]
MPVTGCDKGGQYNHSAIKADEPFPVLQLPGTADGVLHSFPDQSGKVYVVNFWATWCGPCRKEMPSLQRLAAQLDPEHYTVLGVSVDSDQHLVKEFLLEQQIHFANLLDEGGVTFRDNLGGSVLPSTFIIGPDGKLKDFVFGEREWDSSEILEKLQSYSRQRG